jgi:hypothetical protein
VTRSVIFRRVPVPAPPRRVGVAVAVVVLEASRCLSCCGSMAGPSGAVTSWQHAGIAEQSRLAVRSASRCRMQSDGAPRDQSRRVRLGWAAAGPPTESCPAASALPVSRPRREAKETDHDVSVGAGPGNCPWHSSRTPREKEPVRASARVLINLREAASLSGSIVHAIKASRTTTPSTTVHQSFTQLHDFEIVPALISPEADREEGRLASALLLWCERADLACRFEMATTPPCGGRAA